MLLTQEKGVELAPQPAHGHDLLADAVVTNKAGNVGCSSFLLELGEEPTDVYRRVPAISAYNSRNSLQNVVVVLRLIQQLLVDMAVYVDKAGRHCKTCRVDLENPFRLSMILDRSNKPICDNDILDHRHIAGPVNNQPIANHQIRRRC